MKRIDKLLNFAYSRDTVARGMDYLTSLVSYFGEIVENKRIIVTRISNENPGTATIVVHYNKGQFIEPHSYTLEGTPCHNVTNGNICVYRDRVFAMFPQDVILKELGINSYIGIPLLSTEGKVLGVIAVMGENSLSETDSDEITLMLRVASTRVAHVLEGEILTSQNLALEERYRKLYENARSAILILDPFTVSDCNNSTLKLFECTKDDIVNHPISSFSPEFQEDRKKSEDKIHSLLSAALDSDVKPFDWTFISKNGRTFFSEITLTRLELGGKVFIEAVIQDITDKKRSAMVVQEERDFAEMIIETLPGRFVLYDISAGLEDAKLAKINHKWHAESLGFEASDLATIRPEFFFASNDDDKINETLAELLENKSVEVELNTLHKQGYIVPMLYRASIFERDGVKYLMAFGLDISERKSAEKALKLSEERMVNIFNSGSDGILVLDMDFRIINANNTMLDLFGYSLDEVIYSSIFDYLPQQYSNMLKTRNEILVKGEVLSPLELEVNKKNGDLIPVEINSKLMKFGDFEGIVTVVRDVTERRMYEKKIFNSVTYTEERERERLAKELHDGLGPILSTCKIYLHSLNERIGEDKELLKVSLRALTLMDDALGSIKEISNNLSPHILRNFGLVHAVLSFTHNLESVSKIRFDISHRYETRVNEVFEFTVYRIITELINNTIKHSQASEIKIVIDLEEPLLKVSYSDNGKGFDMEEVLKRNKGFGLLNIQARVSKLNGNFSYVTSPGNGVKVDFTLNSNNARI